MSFLGDLGKGLLGAIPIIGPALSNLGSTLGKQQQGAAAGAATQAQIQDEHDRNAIANYQAQQTAQNQAAQTDLERQQFGLDRRGTNAKDAFIGALLGHGLQPTVPGAVIQSSLLKSLNSNPAAMAAMTDLSGQAQTGLDTPATFTGGQLVTPPTMTALPDVGTGASSLAKGLQLAGVAAPSFLEILKRIGQHAGTGDETYGSSDPASGYGGGF